MCDFLRHHLKRPISLGCCNIYKSSLRWRLLPVRLLGDAVYELTVVKANGLD